MNKAEDTEVEVAVEVVKDLMYLVSPDKRIAVLTKAIADLPKELNIEEMVIKPYDFAEWSKSRAARYWNDIMKFKARVVFKFVRTITNNHSRDKAAKLLFDSYPLEEYLNHVGMVRKHERNKQKAR